MWGATCSGADVGRYPSIQAKLEHQGTATRRTYPKELSVFRFHFQGVEISAIQESEFGPARRVRTAIDHKIPLLLTLRGS